jgi:S1-C subfamily serine protease
VDDHDDLLLQLNSGVVGKAIDLEILRGGKPQNLKLTVGEQEEPREEYSHRRFRGRRWGWGWRR